MENEKMQEEEFDQDYWFHGGPPPPPPSILKEVNSNKLILELAFHEAGHLVFSVISEKLKLGFSALIAIKISPNDQNGNFVTGFHSPYPETDYDSSVKKKKWYLEGEKNSRLFIQVFVLLAGYTSYQAFICFEKYFINPSIASSQNAQANYFRLDCLPNPSPSDFERIREMLGWINKDTIDELIRLQKITLSIMRNPSVSNAMRFVKNYLMRNVNREIKLPELNYLRRLIKRQTRKILLSKYISK